MAETSRIPEYVPPEDVELVDFDAMVAAEPMQLSRWVDMPKMAYKVMAAMDRLHERKDAEPLQEERTYIWRPK